MARGPYYSLEEDAIIKAIYPNKGAKECLSLLPLRTLVSIRCRAIQVLHLKLLAGKRSALMKEVATKRKRPKKRRPSAPPALDVLNLWGRNR